MLGRNMAHKSQQRLPGCGHALGAPKHTRLLTLMGQLDLDFLPGATWHTRSSIAQGQVPIMLLTRFVRAVS